MVGGERSPAPVELVLGDGEAGERLDRVLAARLDDVSRATVQRWIDEGRVLVEGAIARPSQRVRAGARVVVRRAPPPSSEAEPEAIPLDVLYEDPAILVLDKPAGLVVHPAAGHAGGTLVNALLHHATVERGEDPARPGIVHRLDKDTSGVMVVAKTLAARDALVRAFKVHAIERVYRAIAVGVLPDQVTYDTLHGRHPTRRRAFTGRASSGRRAVTHVRVLERLHGAAHVECRLETGRTHQIRVHLSEHGAPLLGDPLYGRTPADPVLRAAAARLGRQALHAAVLGFAHPVTGAPLRFEAPEPDDLRAALAALRRGP